MNKAGTIFILAIVGLIVVAVVTFYVGGSPVWSAGICAALGAGCGVLYNNQQRRLNQQAGQ